MLLKKERAHEEKRLNEESTQEGVKGLKAKSELNAFHGKDMTDSNKAELSLQAAFRKAEKEHAKLIPAMRAAEEKAAQQKKDASRAALAEKSAAFNF
jgi:hypothetical protein